MCCVQRPLGGRPWIDLHMLPRCGRAEWGLQVPLGLWFPARSWKGSGQAGGEACGRGTCVAEPLGDCSVLRFCGHLLRLHRPPEEQVEPPGGSHCPPGRPLCCVHTSPPGVGLSSIMSQAVNTIQS